jgi:hypothetical protein
MSTYRQLLLSPEWKTKRNEILQRDFFCCSNCSNKNLIEDLKSGIIHFDNQYHWPTKVINNEIELKIINYKTNEIVKRKVELRIVNPDFENINIVYYKSEIRKLTNTTSIEDFFVVAVRNIDIYEYLEEPIKDDFISFLIGNDHYKLKGYISDNTYESIYSKEYSKFKWHHVNGLHVHHNYYQLGKDPWEYPNDALTTFCWVCHENFHKENKVPYLDKNGFKIGELTPCFRCSGAGIFPEYYHVEEGICFRCSGAKYEELINKIT